MKSITIELTQRCPNQCLHCSSFSGKCSPPVLSVQQVTELIRSAHDLGATEVAFSGGEPLIQMTQLLAGIDVASELKMKVYIYTSGLIPSDQTVSRSIVQPNWMWETIYAHCKKAIPVFDIPTIDSALYDFITMYDRFGECWTEICPERRLPKIMGLMNHLRNKIGFDPEVNFVPTRLTCNSFEFVLNWARDNKYRMNALAYVEQGRATQYSTMLSLSWAEFNRIRMVLESLSQRQAGKNAKMYDLRIGTPLMIPRESSDSSHYCTACHEKCVVRYDGKVTGCEAFKQLSIIQGALEPDPKKAFAWDINQVTFVEACKSSEFTATESAIKSIMERIKTRTPCPVQNLMYNRPEAHKTHELGEYRYE